MSILKERQKTHGEYSGVARVAQRIKDEIWSSSIPNIHQESLDMIATKMARIVNGDHNEPDHWIDIIGYAQLVLNHIKKVSPGNPVNKESPDDKAKLGIRIDERGRCYEPADDTDSRFSRHLRWSR
jgi:hypothetical protein